MMSEDGKITWLLPLGFAAAITMWAVAYIGRLPAVTAPSWLVGLGMLAAVGFWGCRSGRWTGAGWAAGVGVGLVAATVNMLILGSLLGSAESPGLVPSALWWAPGSLLVTALIAAAAAAVGSRRPAADRPEWAALFSRVALVATFLLIVAGGLVTSNESGLAVVDWPNSYGYNMFLYPLSKMTGGIYYEHAHRLFGSLVGLTTVALALYLWRRESRRWVRRLAAAAVVVVVVQGILGGLRVTGSFTLSTAIEDMAPSIALAVVHGVLGQVFLGLIVGLAVVLNSAWRTEAEPQAFEGSDLDRSLQPTVLAILLVQLVLGAAQRHLEWGLVVHITIAAVVWLMASLVGARAWGLHGDRKPLTRLGKWVVIVCGVQVLLGIGALAVTGGKAVVGDPGPFEVTIATAHQACGALLLALVVALTVWTRRLLTE